MRILFLFVALILVSRLDSQEFSFSLSFMDSQGFEDSLRIGFDPLATDQIDSVFGEKDVSGKKADSGILVRCMSDLLQFNFDTLTPKFKVNIRNGSCLGNSEDFSTIGFAIEVITKNWPILLAWDSSKFDSNSLEHSLMTAVPPGGWFDVGSLASINGINTITLNEFSRAIVTSNFDGNDAYGYINSDGDSVSLFWLAFSKMDIFSNVIEETNETAMISVYPNPFMDFIKIHTPANVNVNGVRIFDMSGKVFLQKEGRIEDEIRVPDLKSGVYLISIETVKGFRIIRRLIKV